MESYRKDWNHNADVADQSLAMLQKETDYACTVTALLCATECTNFEGLYNFELVRTQSKTLKLNCRGRYSFRYFYKARRSSGAR